MNKSEDFTLKNFELDLVKHAALFNKLAHSAKTT